MAIIKNLTVDKNSTFAVEVILYTRQKLFFNLTGYTVHAQIRKAPTSINAAAIFGVTISDAVNGKIILMLTDEQTDLIKPGRYVYDVVVENSQGQKYRALEGQVTVTPSVTR